MAETLTKPSTSSPDASGDRDKSRGRSSGAQENLQGLEKVFVPYEGFLGTSAVKEQLRKSVAEPVQTALEDPAAGTGFLDALLGTSMLEPPIERHAEIMSDPRFSHPANAATSSRIVNRLHQTYGNGHVQRVMDVAQRKRGKKAGKGKSLLDRFIGATYSQAFLIAANMTDAEKREFLRRDANLWPLFNSLGKGNFLMILTKLVGVSTVPDKFDFRYALAAMFVSPETIMKNTARRIVYGDIIVHFIEDLKQPDNADDLLKGYGLDPAKYTMYYLPGRKKPAIVQKNFIGFWGVGKAIFVSKKLTGEALSNVLAHETNHARNPKAKNALEQYQTEFRAYFTVDFRNIPDEDERAEKVKKHILEDYHSIRAVYNADPKVKDAIDAYKRPKGNILNL